MGFLRYGLTLVVPETAGDFRRDPETVLKLPPQNKRPFFKVAIGKEGIKFFPRLPGYVNSWIPGCVLEAVVEITARKPDMTQAEFSRTAKELNFFAHLASQSQVPKSEIG